MNITTDPRDEDRKPPSNPWLERIELRCAQAWAEAFYDFEVLQPQTALAFSDVLACKRAWIQVHALRLGHTIEFDYVGAPWRTVAPGVAVKP